MTRAAAIASRAALAVLLAGAFLRALVMLEPFPYWSGDPTLINIPITSLGPAGSLLLDTVSLLAAAAILVFEPLLSRRILWLPFGLVCVGSVGLLAHGWADRPSLDDIRIGATWAAALFGALAAAHAARDAHTARLLAAASIGLIAMLAAKAFVQVFIEHPMTVDQYRQSREMFLAAQGWTPGSAAALNFERRLDQPEATTWFGLANVTASFAAASLTALLGWTILAWRETRAPDQRLPSGWSGLLSIGTLAALVAVILAGGKGGYLAALLGLAVMGLAALLGATHRPALRRAVPKLAPILPLALIAAALATLLLRGLLGERLSELSLLFRWFYISTATRIFTLHPIFGIGPANFQDAYQLLKPAISPEDVTSPHSVVFDYAATLGLFGLAFAAVFLLWASLAGAVLLRSIGAVADDSPSPSHRLTVSPSHLSSPRSDLWFLLFTTAAPTLLSAWIEASIATPDSTIMRLLGLAAWIGIALAALALMRLTDAWRIPFAAAAIVLAVHGQIEVTPIWPGSCSLYFLILAVAGYRPQAPVDIRPRHRFLGYAPAAVVVTVALGLGASNLIFGILGWELSLAQAARTVEPIAAFRTRYEVLAHNPRAGAGDSLGRLHDDIQRSLDRPSAGDRLEDDLLQLMSRDWCAAQRKLHEFASVVSPAHLPTRLAASRLSLQIATATVGPRRLNAPEWADRAETIAIQATDAFPNTAASWGWLGTLRAARYDLDHDLSHLERAIAAWTRAAALDPHGLSMPLRLMRAYDQLGNADLARLWAGRALQANANLRLDPLKQLSPADLAEATQRAAP